jgi:hypothetical protein
MAPESVPEPSAPRTVVQIVPQLPPALGGVAGYALALARSLRDHAGVTTRFLVTDPAWRAEEWSEAGLMAQTLERQEARSLRRALEELTELTGDGGSPVLLHYANYAYERRGCPFWLAGGVTDWKSAARNRLLTFFHEVYASGPPRRSSFWLAPVQRHLAARLVRLSDRSATSLLLYAGLLEKLVPGSGPAVLPVLSPLGEPVNPLPLAERRRHLAVFGGAGARRNAYGPCGSALAAACRSLEIEEVLDVGAPLSANDLPGAIGGVPLRPIGPLSDRAASDLLCTSFAGFVAYPPQFLAKSTIFAAYCSHGLLPVGAREPDASSPDGEIFWTPGDPTSPAELQAMAAAARTWYLRHSALRHATAFQELLFQ